VPNVFPALALRRGHLPPDLGRAVGGKTVPESVAENRLVFATLTAPSVGTVHGRRDLGRCCHPPPTRDAV